MKAAVIVFALAAAFYAAVQLGWPSLGSGPHRPQPVELARIVTARASTTDAARLHAEIPRHVETGHVGDYGTVGRG